MKARGVLYSFRRCPYAIRARLALAAAAVAVEVREVALKAKPPELLEASAKGTVPVLVLADGQVLAESLAILHWALAQPSAPLESRGVLNVGGQAAAWITECDGPFKRHLDGFRYGDAAARPRHRREALAILRRWSQTLRAMGVGGGPEPGGLAPLGWAVLPFVRQFRLSDPSAFAEDADLEPLKGWLARFEAGDALARVMEPPWAWRQAWRSPRWLYHLALAEEWREARQRGVYSRSTRGRSLAEVGFVHACWSHQVEPTWRRFYGDAPELRLLVIDPARLEAAGVAVREEPAPGSGERFPHLFGPVPIEAVLLAERFEPLTGATDSVPGGARAGALEGLAEAPEEGRER